MAEPDTMLEQGSLMSIGLDKKPKKRRPLPTQPMMDPQNTLAQMAMQRPMMGSDLPDVDPEGMMKRKMY